jgi:hypothetical protein
VAFFVRSLRGVPDSSAASELIVDTTMPPQPRSGITVSVLVAPEPPTTNSHSGSPSSRSAAAVESVASMASRS